MRDFLHRRTRGRLVLAVAVAVLLIAAAVFAAALGRSPERPAAVTSPPAGPSTRATSPIPAQPSTSIPVTPTQSGVAALPPLSRTSSADVYAAEVARALWNVDYADTSRAALLAFWRGELADALPDGTPAGATLAQAHAAAMATLRSRLPSAVMWATLARGQTVSRSTVTSVSEPASWVAAVTAGRIADPGLSARTVLGVQSISYGTGPARRTTRQTQQVTVAVLCPPTTGACRLEILPPTGDTGVAGGTGG